MDKLVSHGIRMLEIVEGENDFFRNDAKRQADIARAVYDTILRVQALERKADRKTEPTMRLHEWTSDDITFCTAKCEVKCFRKPKHIKHKDIPHSFSDFSNICVEYEPMEGE